MIKNWDESFDYIVIGAGSAGCTVAGRLAERNVGSVLVLEVGPADRHPFIPLPCSGPLLLETRLNHQYVTSPQTHLDQEGRHIPQGRTLGGGSSTNGLLYMRGQAGDYDGWAGQGCEGWSYKEVLPYFIRSEGNQRLNNTFHGAEGPLTVSDPQHISELTRAFVRACQEAGIPFSPDFNGARQSGVGYNQLTMRDGKRCSAARAYLHPAKETGNLEIRTNCLVQKIVTENGKATGIRYEQNGRIHNIRCDGEVILSAGAAQSPKLLMLSGIGPADHLKEHGIDIVKDLPGVGENLQDHVEAPVVALCDGKRHGYFGENKGFKALKNLTQYLAFGTGPMSSNIIEACAFLNIDDDKLPPNVQFHFLPIVFLARKQGKIEHAGGSIMTSCNKPRSKGTVRLLDTNPKSHPIMDPAYLSDPEDLRITVAAIEKAREVLATRAFRQFVGPEHLPGLSKTDPYALQTYVREHAKTIYHPVGSCRMGINEGSVVDPQLKVHGIEKLRVIDASVMPDITSANTNAPTIMIGEKGVDMISNNTPLPPIDPYH